MEVKGESNGGPHEQCSILSRVYSPEKAKWVMESKRRWFRGGGLKLEWWSLEAGCMKSLETVEKAWIKVVGLPLHL